MAQYTYPAVFTKEKDGGYSIHFPDIDGCYSQGSDINDGMFMANDALALMLYDKEECGEEIPEPSRIEDVSKGNEEFVTYVSCNTDVYREREKKRNRTIKKTLSIPEWLNEEALAAGLNFSQVLQEALKAKLKLA